MYGSMYLCTFAIFDVCVDGNIYIHMNVGTRTYLYDIEFARLGLRSQGYLFDDQLVRVHYILLWYFWYIELCDWLFFAQRNT